MVKTSSERDTSSFNIEEIFLSCLHLHAAPLDVYAQFCRNLNVDMHAKSFLNLTCFALRSYENKLKFSSVGTASCSGCFQISYKPLVAGKAQSSTSQKVMFTQPILERYVFFYLHTSNPKQRLSLHCKLSGEIALFLSLYLTSQSTCDLWRR